MSPYSCLRPRGDSVRTSIAASSGTERAGSWLQKPGDVGKGVVHVHARAGDDEVADPLVVVGAAHLEDLDPASHLAADGHVVEQRDGIADGGHVELVGRL